MIKQEIIRDNNYNIIEYIDTNTHIKYNENGRIVYYKKDKFEFPTLIDDINSLEKQRFLNLIKSSSIIEYYNNILILSKDEEYLFEYNPLTTDIQFNYKILYNIFEPFTSTYYLHYEEVLESIFKKYFNCDKVMSDMPF